MLIRVQRKVFPSFGSFSSRKRWWFCKNCSGQRLFGELTSWLMPLMLLPTFWRDFLLFFWRFFLVGEKCRRKCHIVLFSEPEGQSCYLVKYWATRNFLKIHGKMPPYFWQFEQPKLKPDDFQTKMFCCDQGHFLLYVSHRHLLLFQNLEKTCFSTA